LRRRPSRLGSRFEVANVRLNTSRYMLSEFSYMLLMTERLDMTKKRIEPRLATGRQGLTLVHFSAQLKRFLWERGCIYGLFRGYTGGVREYEGV